MLSIKGKTVAIGVMGVIGAGFLLANVVAWQLRSIITSVPAPVKSPDGSMTAQLSVTDSRGEKDTHMRLAVVVRDGTGREILRRQTKASAMRAYELSWESNDAVLLKSAEIGPMRWTRTERGRWTDVPDNTGKVIPSANAPTK